MIKMLETTGTTKYRPAEFPSLNDKKVVSQNNEDIDDPDTDIEIDSQSDDNVVFME